MENLTGGTPPVRYLLCVVPCKLYFTTIKTTHPDIYRDNFNYDVLVYGDENGTEELTMQGFYDETKGVFKVSTKDITTDLYIYVIDESRMSKKKTDTDFREELEQRAIVRKVIHL